MARKPKTPKTGGETEINGEKVTDSTASVETGKKLPEGLEAMLRSQFGDNVVIIKSEADIPKDLPEELVAGIKEQLSEESVAILAKPKDIFGKLFGEADESGSLEEFLQGMFGFGREDSGKRNLMDDLKEVEKRRLETCQCAGCKRRRGEKVDDSEDSLSLRGLLEKILAGSKKKAEKSSYYDNDIRLLSELVSRFVESRVKNGDEPPLQITMKIEVVESDGKVAEYEIEGSTV